MPDRKTAGFVRGMVLAAAAWTLAGGPLPSAQRTASTVEPPRTVDGAFRFEIKNPAYPPGRGPVVLVDEAHSNFHTAVGTYIPFADLIRRDGFVVRRARTRITRALLLSCGIFVIADAQPPARQGDPPTFSRDEIVRLRDWVENGGALFLITDHMPDPGAIEPLARAFGIEPEDGYVLNGTLRGGEAPLVFSRSTPDRLGDHPVLRGRDPAEAVERIATFAGSAFRAGPGFFPVMILGPGRRSWKPEKYWEFPPGTPSRDVGGWFQGGVSLVGKGRIAFFSEAAMFTAQVFNRGRVKAGMNHPLARDNARLLLNVMRWLSGLLPSQ